MTILLSKCCAWKIFR